MRKLLIPLVALALLGGGAFRVYSSDNPGRTAAAASSNKPGPGKKITAVGTVEPEEVIDLGAQVTGLVTDLKVDYGSNVEGNTVLAMIDATVYKLRLDQEQANCEIARADLEKARIDLEQAQAQWRIAQEQHKSATMSESDYNLAEFRQKAAKVAVARAEAVVAKNKAALQRAQIDLANTTIRSPVKGVIIDRRVNLGQTVVSSSSAASLFLIGKLDRWQLLAHVKESEIVKIHEGQRVRFTVAAWPGKVFEGEVRQIRLNARMFQSAVAYTVVVAISSAPEKLLPYMTANVEFE
jgi:HlyD family secretion protein